ncbi:DcrB-related protein [Pseudomonas sp. NPDC089406]|uniref:DcrB-related protein n=1 Tax=Pseudomonas sp. NPDC089406 TaxID=3364463 RepID=UPI00384F40F9
MSQLSPLVCTFNEGSVSVPSGYRDNTVNALVPGGAGGAAFNIARDCLEADEALQAYVERQLKLMRQHLSGWQQRDRLDAWLGEQRLPGLRVQATYLRGQQRIDQVQAVFSPVPGQVLVFTASRSDNLHEHDLETFDALLSSFVPAS